MGRRELIFAMAGAWAALNSPPVFSQSPRPLRRIGWLVSGNQEAYGPLIQSFRTRLTELGYVDGRDIEFEFRWTDGTPEKLQELAEALVRLNPAVIVTAGSAATKVLQNATQTIPVVFATAIDPVKQKLVASLRRPGGNITGLVNNEQTQNKAAELVRESIPKASTVSILTHEADPASPLSLSAVERPLRALKLEPRNVSVRDHDDLARAFVEVAGQKPDALFVLNLSLFQVLRSNIAELAFKHRLPVFSTRTEQTVAGGLMSYSHDTHVNYRRAAALVDKILKGAKPADLPVEQPDRFKLTVNLKTARILGLTVPKSLLVRADRLIE
jgi:putative tryptophan/tyrosine transport system substrate-binding protein